jgi:hypothetical protein
MSTITTDQQASIAKKLASMHLPSGLGDEQSACSIAAINLALSGRLTAAIPNCMSEVIGRWVIAVQDAMPGEMRNSEEWKSLLPLAAGTGRGQEQARLDIILDWMWGTVLPSLQTLADQQGFGEQWQKMTTDRTVESANAAAEATWEDAWAAHRVARAAAWATAWADFDPCGLLERLIKIDNNAQEAA